MGRPFRQPLSPSSTGPGQDSSLEQRSPGQVPLPCGYGRGHPIYETIPLPGSMRILCHGGEGLGSRPWLGRGYRASSPVGRFRDSVVSRTQGCLRGMGHCWRGGGEVQLWRAQ